MATGQIALIREQGVNFGVVCVPDHVVDHPNQREDQLRIWTAQLGVPVALLGAQRHRTYGRKDIVGWLGSVDVNRLPWRNMTF
ncbi:hypothetical protein [Rhodopseudomonas sp. RCAM05734]|uniref:hypothetical protein n=1 Tax=Rhodopseudomonas sp. RCAM05734 TaxID=3457549 RepID=UPI004043A014